MRQNAFEKSPIKHQLASKNTAGISGNHAKNEKHIKTLKRLHVLQKQSHFYQLFSETPCLIGPACASRLK